MANPVKQARELTRRLKQASRAAAGIRPVTGAALAPKSVSEALAKELVPKLLARGLIE